MFIMPYECILMCFECVYESLLTWYSNKVFYKHGLNLGLKMAAATAVSYANVLYSMFIENSESYSVRNHTIKPIRDTDHLHTV